MVHSQKAYRYNCPQPACRCGTSRRVAWCPCSTGRPSSCAFSGLGSSSAQTAILLHLSPHPFVGHEPAKFGHLIATETVCVSPSPHSCCCLQYHLLLDPSHCAVRDPQASTKGTQAAGQHPRASRGVHHLESESSSPREQPWALRHSEHRKGSQPNKWHLSGR